MGMLPILNMHYPVIQVESTQLFRKKQVNTWGFAKLHPPKSPQNFSQQKTPLKAMMLGSWKTTFSFASFWDPKLGGQKPAYFQWAFHLQLAGGWLQWFFTSLPKKGTHQQPCGGNSIIFKFSPPIWGNGPFWRFYFSYGLKPPTRQLFAPNAPLKTSKNLKLDVWPLFRSCSFFPGRKAEEW